MPPSNGFPNRRKFSGSLELYSLEAPGKLVKSLQTEMGFADVSFSNDGARLVACVRQEMPVRSMLMSVPELEEIATFDAGFTVGIFADGSRIFGAGGKDHDDSELLKIWSIKDQKELNALRSFQVPKHYFAVNAAACSQDGTIIASSRRTEVQIWTPAMKELKCGFPQMQKSLEVTSGYVGQILLSADNGLLAGYCPYEANITLIWDLRTGENLSALGGEEEARQIPVIFLGDHRTLLLRERAELVGYDARAKKETFRMPLWDDYPSAKTPDSSSDNSDANAQLDYVQVAMSGNGRILAAIRPDKPSEVTIFEISGMPAINVGQEKADDKKDSPQKVSSNERESAKPAVPDNKPVIRKWSSANGKFQVDAEYVSQSGGMVSLRKSNGTVINVKIDALSKADQTFLLTLPN